LGAALAGHTDSVPSPVQSTAYRRLSCMVWRSSLGISGIRAGLQM
jgi:hypothetical protein